MATTSKNRATARAPKNLPKAANKKPTDINDSRGPQGAANGGTDLSELRHQLVQLRDPPFPPFPIPPTLPQPPVVSGPPTVTADRRRCLVTVSLLRVTYSGAMKETAGESRRPFKAASSGSGSGPSTLEILRPLAKSYIRGRLEAAVRRSQSTLCVRARKSIHPTQMRLAWPVSK